jgi:hypothetical protein
MRRNIQPLFISSLAALAAAHCGGEPAGDPTSTGAADTAACGALIDRSGHGVPDSLKDSLATMIFNTGTDCPTNLKDILAKLARLDTNGCSGSGLSVALVSETSQLLGRPDDFRAVFARGCAATETKLVLSPQAPTSLGQPLPQEVEVMSFDDSRGVFNFYAADGAQWRYFGDSLELLEGVGGAAGRDQVRRCANCHRGGGPIMKEIHNPWANWDGATSLGFNGGTPSPGSDRVIAQLTGDLGMSPGSLTKLVGPDLENLVTAGIQAFTPARVAFLRKSGALADVLRPVFCTVEFNLRGAPVFRAPMSVIPEGFLVDDVTFNVVNAKFPLLAPAAFRPGIRTANQRMLDGNGTQLQDERGRALVDTGFAFMHPEPSVADLTYGDELVSEGVVTRDFLTAVRGVDLTVPVFSQERCDLLRFVPELEPSEVDLADRVTAGFITRLEQEGPPMGTPAATLLANLKSPAAVQGSITQYLDTCGRAASDDPQGLAADMLTVLSRRRDQVRTFPISSTRSCCRRMTCTSKATYGSC